MEFQQPTKATLDFGSKPIDNDALYLVDFSKMTSVNDLVMILAAMHISFEASHPQFDLIKQFLNLDNPIKLNRQQPTQQKEMVLPKLKTIK